MAAIPIEATVSTEQLIQAAAQLPPEELALLLARLLDIQAHNVTAERSTVEVDEEDRDIAALAARVQSSQRRIFGLSQGGITTTADFDAPLSDEFWLGNE
jgi:hypothetical protein